MASFQDDVIGFRTVGVDDDDSLTPTIEFYNPDFIHLSPILVDSLSPNRSAAIQKNLSFDTVCWNERNFVNSKHELEEKAVELVPDCLVSVFSNNKRAYLERIKTVTVKSKKCNNDATTHRFDPGNHSTQAVKGTKRPITPHSPSFYNAVPRIVSVSVPIRDMVYESVDASRRSKISRTSDALDEHENIVEEQPKVVMLDQLGSYLSCNYSKQLTTVRSSPNIHQDLVGGTPTTLDNQSGWIRNHNGNTIIADETGHSFRNDGCRSRSENQGDQIVRHTPNNFRTVTDTDIRVRNTDSNRNLDCYDYSIKCSNDNISRPIFDHNKPIYSDNIQVEEINFNRSSYGYKTDYNYNSMDHVISSPYVVCEISDRTGAIHRPSTGHFFTAIQSPDKSSPAPPLTSVVSPYPGDPPLHSDGNQSAPSSRLDGLYEDARSSTAFHSHSTNIELNDDVTCDDDAFKSGSADCTKRPTDTWTIPDDDQQARLSSHTYPSLLRTDIGRSPSTAGHYPLEPTPMHTVVTRHWSEELAAKSPDNSNMWRNQLRYNEGSAFTPSTVASSFGNQLCVDNTLEPTLRAPCSCKKSRCLKLYCDCFRTKNFCDGCYCFNCANLEGNESERHSSMNEIVRRNPTAFAPRVKATPEEKAQKNLPGCSCRKSGCLKKYCECFNTGTKCSGRCQCFDCQNSDRAGTTTGLGSQVDEALAIARQKLGAAQTSALLTSIIMSAANLGKSATEQVSTNKVEFYEEVPLVSPVLVTEET